MNVPIVIRGPASANGCGEKFCMPVLLSMLASSTNGPLALAGVAIQIFFCKSVRSTIEFDVRNPSSFALRAQVASGYQEICRCSFEITQVVR